VSAGTVGTLDLKSKKITAAVLPRSGLKRPGLQRPPPRGSQTQILQETGTSGTQTKGKEKLHTCGPSATGPKLSESKGPSYGPGQRQRRSRATREGNQAKKP